MSISNSQRLRTQVFEDCNDDIVQYFFKSNAIDVGPAIGAIFLRKFAQVSKTQQQLVEQCLRLNPALSLASTHQSIPEMVTRGKEKKQIRLLVKDLLQRHDAVYLNLSGRKELPFIKDIIKIALKSPPASHLLIDMSVDVAAREKDTAQNFPDDSRRLEAVIDAAIVVDRPVSKTMPKAKIEMVLKGRHLQARLIKRLAGDGMPPLHKLDLSDVKLVVPSIPFRPEMQRFFVPELLRYLQILMRRGEMVELNLCNCGIGDAAATLLLTALQQQDQVIEQLHLHGNPIAVDHPIWRDARVKGAPQIQ